MLRQRVQDRGTLRINEWFATCKPESLNSCAMIQKRKNERKKKNEIGFMAFSLCQDPSDIRWWFLKTGGVKFRPTVWNKSRWKAGSQNIISSVFHLTPAWRHKTTKQQQQQQRQIIRVKMLWTKLNQAKYKQTHTFSMTGYNCFRKQWNSNAATVSSLIMPHPMMVIKLKSYDTPIFKHISVKFCRGLPF